MQFLVTTDVIGVNMGFKDVRDPHSILTGQIEVVLHIALWIYHTGDFGLRATDEVGKTTHSFNRDLFKIHIPPSIEQSWCGVEPMA